MRNENKIFNFARSLKGAVRLYTQLHDTCTHARVHHVYMHPWTHAHAPMHVHLCTGIRSTQVILALFRESVLPASTAVERHVTRHPHELACARACRQSVRIHGGGVAHPTTWRPPLHRTANPVLLTRLGGAQPDAAQ